MEKKRKEEEEKINKFYCSCYYTQSSAVNICNLKFIYIQSMWPLIPGKIPKTKPHLMYNSWLRSTWPYHRTGSGSGLWWRRRCRCKRSTSSYGTSWLGSSRGWWSCWCHTVIAEVMDKMLVQHSGSLWCYWWLEVWIRGLCRRWWCVCGTSWHTGSLLWQNDCGWMRWRLRRWLLLHVVHIL